MTEATWRFIRTGDSSPAFNMAADEAILLAHGENKVPPTVRFYGWNPATLSIGYFQKAREEVDFEALNTQGIGFVRRPTGGRAVLHDLELTYSIIVQEGHPGIPMGVTEAYRVLSLGLLYGFRKLGLKAEMVRLQSEADKHKYASEGSAACFDSPSWYELVVEGRKVAGSAQVRQKGVILQHGSILLELDVDQLFSLLRIANERTRERLKRAFAGKAVAINDVRRELGLAPLTMADLEQAFRFGMGMMAEGLELQLVDGELTDEERSCADRLVQEKYGSESWNFRR